jgi:hypothetical protein
VLDREPPGLEVDLRCSVDLELFGSPRPTAVLLLLNPMANCRRLGVVDEAQALVAHADSLLEKGKEQLVALGGAGVEGTHMCPRTNLAHTQETHAHRLGDHPISRPIRLYAERRNLLAWARFTWSLQIGKRRRSAALPDRAVRLSNRRDPVANAHCAGERGWMFLLLWNTFSGSYFAFTSASRQYASSP